MADNNRIGEACWYKTYDYTTRKYSEWKGGRLRAWSTNHVEFESGPGLFPCAVVEDDKTRQCLSVEVEQVCFASAPPAFE